MRLNSAAGLLIGLFVLDSCGQNEKINVTTRESARPGAVSSNNGQTTSPPAGSANTHIINSVDGGGHFLAQAGSIVRVDAGNTVIGFAGGVLRQSVDVPAFSITKYPVTVKQYKDCVAAGVCGEPTFSECPNSTLPITAMGGDDANAALCVGHENAVAYCGYIGGRLPTLPEWMRAARGAEVRSYAWGDTRASCAQHARSDDLALSSQPPWFGKLSVSGCAADEVDAVRVGQHSAGASPFQVEDVLLAPGELMEGSSASPFRTCDETQHCFAVSHHPGRLDGVGTYAYLPHSNDSAESPPIRVAPALWSFRCAAAE